MVGKFELLLDSETEKAIGLAGIDRDAPLKIADMVVHWCFYANVRPLIEADLSPRLRLLTSFRVLWALWPTKQSLRPSDMKSSFMRKTTRTLATVCISQRSSRIKRYNKALRLDKIFRCTTHFP